jgi:hypothetical protein
MSNAVSISNVVLNGCETWCLKLREEHRLRVFDNRVLRQIFKKGAKALNEIIWLRIGEVADSCEYSNGPSGSNNAGNFLTS